MIWQTPPAVVVRLDFATGRIGHGKVRLLEQIGRSGSVAQAARAIGMSYPRAMTLIAQIDAVLGERAVLRSAGGARGGHAALTRPAGDLVSRYRAIETAAQRAVTEEPPVGT